MGKLTYKTVVLALAAMVLPSLAWAAGLGKLTVLSAIGQPLRAEIEVVSLQPGEADTLLARLGSVEAFRQANIERGGSLLSIRFAIEQRPGGQVVVLMTSAEPLNEPFVDLLVELNWASGRLVREYTFLLDPPEYKAPTIATPVVPPAAPVVVQPAPPPAPATAEPPRPPIEERAIAAAPVGQPARTYEVKRGDTLSKIANQNMPPGVSLQQMLVALYRGNQDAFDGANMNRLRAGKILNLPEREAVAGVAAADAARLVAAQGTEFAEYRRQLGAAIAQTPGRAEGRRQVTGRIGAPPPEKAPPPKEQAKDQLRLSKADDAKAGGRARAAAAADDASAKDKALKEANERIALLEKNLQDMQKLAQLKSETGAQLQQGAKAASAPGKAPEPAKAAPAPAAKAPEVGKAAEAPKTPEPAKTAEAAKATDALKAPDAPEVPKAVPPTPKPAPKAATPPPPPPPEPSFVDELLDNPVALGGAGGVVILLAGYAAYAWRRKRQQQVQARGSAMETPPLVVAPAASAAVTQQIDRSAAVAPSDVGSANLGKTEVEEIDPIAEADVYMAYGRDAQAEEILKEALANDPSRQAIRLKLLEIYANRKDLKTFESTAIVVRDAVGAQGPDWEKAVALGLSIDPANPLYGGQAGAASPIPAAGDTMVLSQAEIAAVREPEVSAEPVAAPALDFDLDLGGGAATGQVAESATATAEVAATTLDFDLDLGGGEGKQGEAVPQGDNAGTDSMVIDVTAAPEAAAEGGASIDFDLGPTTDAPAAAPTEAKPDASVDTAGGLSMDFNLDLPTEAPAAAEKQAPEVDLSAISLDLGTEPAAGAAPAVEHDAHWQEVATKLDLAKAYQEMGDNDGARELLNEVVKEGDAAQQQQAQSMLNAIG